MSEIEYKFRVANADIPGLPPVKKGTPVIPAGAEAIEGYDYEVWTVLGSSRTVMTRVEHHGEFADVTVTGETMREIEQKIKAVSDGIRGGVS